MRNLSENKKRVNKKGINKKVNRQIKIRKKVILLRINKIIVKKNKTFCLTNS